MGKKQDKAQEKSSSGAAFQVFISGLPYEATEDDIKGFFDFASNPIVKLPKYQDTGRCLGYGHVVFDNNEEVQQALKKDHQNIGKRYINVQKAKGPKQTPVEAKTVPIGCKSLFIKNLPYTINKDQIRKEFSSCGVVKQVRMIRNWQTKKFKGFAYVDFKDNGSVKKAIKTYDGKLYQGRKLFLDAVTTQMKKGFKGDRQENNQNEQQDNKQKMESEQQSEQISDGQQQEN